MTITSLDLSAPFQDRLAEWGKLFAKHGAEPLVLLGSGPSGPVITAVKTIAGEPFDLKQFLVDLLVRIREPQGL